MEGCLLATRQVTWLVRNYAAIGVLSIVATQVHSQGYRTRTTSTKRK